MIADETYVPKPGDRVAFTRAGGLGEGKGLVTLVMTIVMTITEPAFRTEVDVQDEVSGTLVVLNPAVDEISAL